MAGYLVIAYLIIYSVSGGVGVYKIYYDTRSAPGKSLSGVSCYLQYVGSLHLFQ